MNRHPAFRPQVQRISKIEMEPAVVAFGKHAARLVELFIVREAIAAGMSTKEWMRLWRAVPRLELGEGATVQIVVEAERKQA